jgi:ribose transport system permease protein
MKKVFGMVILLLLLCILATWKTPSFVSSGNLQNLSRQIALLSIFAIGEGIIILSGGIDLSVGSVLAFVGVIIVMLTNSCGWNPYLASILALIFCGVLGLAHGVMVCRLKLQPFVVTLCTMMLFRGLGRWLTQDSPAGFDNPTKYSGFRSLGEGLIFGIPTPVIILIGIVITSAFLLHFTKYGRYWYAIGRNEKAVAYSGVNVSAMKTWSYVVCALLTGVAGILYTGYSPSIQASSAGSGYELYAIAAAVLGGCSMRAGEGTIIGIVVGASILKALINIINLVNIPTYLELSVIGCVILAGVIADAMYKQRAAKGEKSVVPKDKRKSLQRV